MFTIAVPALVGLLLGILGLFAPLSISVGLVFVAMLVGVATYTKPVWLRNFFGLFLGGTLNIVLLWRVLSFTTPLLAVVLIRLLIRGL